MGEERRGKKAGGRGGKGKLIYYSSSIFFVERIVSIKIVIFESSKVFRDLFI